MISRRQLLEFMRSEPFAVEASVSGRGEPQAAVVGVVVSDRFEIFFDTLGSSRKAANLRRNPAAALVMGAVCSGAARTLQLEGVADEPRGADLERLLELYLARFPDGRERQKWPDIAYFRITARWLRYSDYAADPPVIAELAEAELAALA